ncbi:membrane transporter [Oryctes borbonicus]|uniref:Membrane transporter n=1 Tax=Oryctes borbonicus TaxID=1629725 RepID=A0A0T6AXB8_9SCAR|nr:membrane transporter [Oryctes borbonicus]
MFLNLENTRYMQYVGALSATLSNTAMGMYATWASPALSILQSEDSPLGRPIDHEEGSWIVSLPKLAAVPASIIGGWLVEKIGRKHSLLIAGILLFLPWLMIIFGTSIWILYAARFIAGLGNGVVIIGCSIYNAEIAENDIRGKLGSIAIVLRLVGSLLTLSVGPHVSYTVLAIISATVPVIFICIYFFMPESPYYLVKAKKPEEAEKSLRILSSKSVSDKFFKERIMEIEQSIEEDMRNKTTLWEFFSNANYRRAIYIMIGK